MITPIIYGADCESGVIVPGNLCPPIVCLSITCREGDSLQRRLLLREAALDWIIQAMGDPAIVTVWHNGPFDLTDFINDCEQLRGYEAAQELMLAILKAYADGRICDTETREKLLLNVQGELQDQGEESDEETRGIPLSSVVKKYLGIDISADKHRTDAWRLRYSELAHVPLENWPADAIRYAEDDSAYNLLVWESQDRKGQELSYKSAEKPWQIIDERRKVSKKFALYLMSAWGVRTDPERVDTISRAVVAGVAQIEELSRVEGLSELTTVKGQVVSKARRRCLQDRVAVAYACASLDLDTDTLRENAQNAVSWARVQELVRSGDLPESVLQRDDITSRCLALLIDQYQCRVEGIPAIWPKKIAPDGGGIQIYPPSGAECVPTTYDPKEPSARFPKGSVSTARVTLLGSPDDVLIKLGQQGELLKLKSTYLPILSHGLVYPINPRYDEMKASGRSSCKNPNMQNLPTFGLYRLIAPTGEYLGQNMLPVESKEEAGAWTGRRAAALLKELNQISPDNPAGSVGGASGTYKTSPVGGLRECFIPRKGWCLLDADIDFAECVAWAQWCYDMFGRSDLRDVINLGEDPHVHLAITFPEMSGWTYTDADRLKKIDLLVKKYRQFAKVGNFGCMGGMQAEALMLQSRMQETFLTLEESQLIVSTFDRRWWESSQARTWAKKQLRQYGGFAPFTQPRSGRIRGYCNYTQLRNQPLQGGTADLADDVLVRLAEECYTGRIRSVPDQTWRTCMKELNTLKRNGREDRYLELSRQMIGEGTISALLDSRPWAFAHDEFILEAPFLSWGPERFHKAGQRLEQIIQERGRFWFPDVAVRAEAAAAWRWVKDRRTGEEFKRVVDSNGFLIPMPDKGH